MSCFPFWLSVWLSCMPESGFFHSSWRAWVSHMGGRWGASPIVNCAIENDMAYNARFGPSAPLIFLYMSGCCSMFSISCYWHTYKKKAASLVSSWILIWTIALSGRKVIRRLISSHVLPKAKGQDGYDQATPGPRASTGTSSRTREFVQLCQEAERTQYSLSPAQVNYEKQAERSTCLCCSPSILSNLC